MRGTGRMTSETSVPGQRRRPKIRSFQCDDVQCAFRLLRGFAARASRHVRSGYRLSLYGDGVERTLIIGTFCTRTIPCTLSRVRVERPASQHFIYIRQQRARRLTTRILVTVFLGPYDALSRENVDTHRSCRYTIVL